jgi:hypothetical protein
MMWHNVQQNTEEWLDLRCGKIGGSSIGKVMANFGKAFGQPAHDLAVKLAIEQITGKRQDSTYSNEHMERGHEQEPIARSLYESEYFCDVTNGGFFEDGDIGFSPDGLVSDDGIIEIKSVIQTVHYATVERGSFDPAYKWQLYFNLKYSGRKWMDYVSFCATFPEGKRLFVHRINRNECGELFSMIESRLKDFRLLIDKKRTTIENIR